MKKRVMLFIAALVLVLSACSGKTSYQDGTYTGEYNSENKKSRMVVEITIKEDKITACTMKSYGADGALKDETYGDNAPDEKMKELAKLAYQGFSQYADLLVEKQNIKEVDAISGATVSYKEFKLAVEDALKQAEK